MYYQVDSYFHYLTNSRFFLLNLDLKINTVLLVYTLRKYKTSNQNDLFYCFEQSFVIFDYFPKWKSP